MRSPMLFKDIDMESNLDNSGEYSENSPLLHARASSHDIPHTFLQTSSNYDSEVEINKRMHMILAAFFMNPIEKWRIRRRFSFKLCFQVLVIVLGAFQMYRFGERRAQHLNQNTEMEIALNKMFLKDWNSGDSNGLPSVNRFYALYNELDFLDSVDFVVRQYANIETLNFGRYAYDSQNSIKPHLRFCVKGHDGQVNPETLTVNIKSLPKEKCYDIPYDVKTYHLNDTFSIAKFLQQSNDTIDFRTLIQVKIEFQLRTIIFKSMNELHFPDCYRLNIAILYNKMNYDGHIPISLKLSTDRLNCQVNIDDIVENDNHASCQPLNVIIILFGLCSIALCVRSLYRSVVLSQEAAWFFHNYYGKTISFSEKMDFVDFWYIIILVGNVLVVSGSCIKLQIETNSIRLTEGTQCSFCLGVGYLLSFMGTLRYFRLFPNYNILMETLKKSIPKLVRFLICVVLLFIGYCFCGFITLAPYHQKFTTFSNTAESLFAAMNGDGLYETSTTLHTDLCSVWWFAKIYMYSFFFLFFYLGASLLGSVIMDAYETVKDMCTNGKTPTTTVEIFLASGGHYDYETISPAPSLSTLHIQENKKGFFQKVLNWLYIHHH
ncbi:hypothetical protein JTE90_009804 [Oedothorax gibbosus]|uniref:Mucolipin-3 n=1 Tax=Oedothorax gibbosus TaxID=931172 RepID=A0AAV6UQN2_9ARAC|nr:hypothetical protein JTE90_009804 [Oedothorax gibbosus]